VLSVGRPWKRANELGHAFDGREEDQGRYTADAAGLLRFLEGEILPWYGVRRTELANRPLICAQAFGEALALTGWSDSAATRSTSTASSNAMLTIIDPVAEPAADR
jgi:hypothetical protein